MRLIFCLACYPLGSMPCDLCVGILSYVLGILSYVLASVRSAVI